MIEPYAIRSEGKILLERLIPREDFLLFLQKMDFVINFANLSNSQMPSKLIDYRLMNKPILDIESTDFDSKLIKQFLEGDYRGRLIVDKLDQYRIENVAREFLKLASYSE